MGFAGEAQIRCARTFVELQQEKIAKLEKDLEIPATDEFCNYSSKSRNKHRLRLNLSENSHESVLGGIILPSVQICIPPLGLSASLSVETGSLVDRCFMERLAIMIRDFTAMDIADGTVITNIRFTREN